MPLFSMFRALVDKHYDAIAKADCNTCHVGAWVIYHENHLLEKSGGPSMINMLKRFTKSRREAVKDNHECAEAVICSDERQGCKILVVSRGNSFSPAATDYAIQMAKRTRSSLVALSLDEHNGNFKEFSEVAKNNIESFSCRAAEQGISFSHEIRQGQQEVVVAKMHEADPRFKYVMDDSAVVCKSRKSIPVYTRATLRAK